MQAYSQELIPSVDDIAALLSDTETRNETLFQMAAVANFISRVEQSESQQAAGLIEEDINWVRRLVARNGKVVFRSPVLDPAAWMIHLKLEQHELLADELVSPLGPGLQNTLQQVFDRSSERLASMVLPELLWELETASSHIWAKFGEILVADETLKQAVMDSNAAWLENWAGAAGEYQQLRSSEVFEFVDGGLDVMVANAIASGPPDKERLAAIRYQLLAVMPQLDEPSRHQASALLRLAGLIDGLHEHRFFSFGEGLLAIAADLLVKADEAPESNGVVSWISENLPLVSGRYAKNFAVVDPRINSALAAVFDVVQGLERASGELPPGIAIRAEIADAVAQLALLIPDLNFYFGLPVRDSIAGGIDACTGMMASTEADGSPAMTRELFDDCQQSLVDLANQEARAPSLSGDPDGPFGDDQLARELSVTSGQRINYGIGYLHDRYSTGCEEPSRPLPNALEWSALATLMAWFAEQSPVYFQTPENEARLDNMRVIGSELLLVVAEQVDCFAGAGAVVSDPISRSLIDYRDALVALSSGINGAVFDFRNKVLAAGADVALHRDSAQPTAYRPDDLLIGPCDPENICEMSGSLTSTRALWGLFPDEYLIADQTGLGKIEICYEDMSWEQRRSEYVRADDTNVANYYGHLQFKLNGRYQSGDEKQDIFGFRFTSPGEHHYLFAAASEEVLEDECPVEWIGERIVTPLHNDRGGIVPNRLTYLAAPRMVPSRLLSANWDRGAEWRDWFITGIGVENLELEPAQSINGEVNQQLQNLHRAEQAAIFQSVLLPPSRGESLGIDSLFAEVNKLTVTKALIRQQIMLFYPQLLTESDDLRTAITGQGGLLDFAMMTRFRADQVPVDSINGIAFDRLERMQQEWQNQPESIKRTGSVSGSLAHAMMRLNALYAKFFAEPVPVVSPVVIPVVTDPVD
jgi:hypothetical protein